MHRDLSFALLTTLVLSSGAACQSVELNEQGELKALLRDDPLTQVPPGTGCVAPAPFSQVAAASGDPAIAGGPPAGRWRFDDCTPDSTWLDDSTILGNTAFRSVGVTCAEGIDGQGVAIAMTDGIVCVPDQPYFTFREGVTVAGWFNPTSTDGTGTLLRKRDQDTSSFALLLNGGRFQFVVRLGEDRAISVTSPQKANAGVFQHVAGTYDGSTLRLYVDGLEVVDLPAPGSIPPGPGPLLMGNDGSERRFVGTIDEAFFATHALDASEVQALACLSLSPLPVFTPTSIPPTPPGVPVAIDVAVSNHNPASCAPIAFELQTLGGPHVIIDPLPLSPVQSAPLTSGATSHFTITATAADSADGGTILPITVQVTETTSNIADFGSIDFPVAEPTGCHVRTSRELMIKDVSVVDDPVRTVFDPISTDPRNGVWTFKHLVESMASAPEDAPAMVEAMMSSFTTRQRVNRFIIAARPGIRSVILDRWPRTPDGALDLAQAPLHLQAIVNRFDLRDLASGDAGEARFVFAFYDPLHALQATIIFEYKLPASNDSDVLGWAEAFHALGELDFGEEYNAALQVITEQFVGRGVRPDHPNGSAINAVRTNEVDFGEDGFWELREFRLSPRSGLLEPVAVKLTPDRSFNLSPTLAAYINANQTAIIADTHNVPEVSEGVPFQAGAIFNDLGTWFAPGVDSEARHHFALNTCNGCHSIQETGTFFLQIQPRQLPLRGDEASLSGFLTGITVSDPETGQSRTFNDLARRNVDLKEIVCAGPAARSAASAAKLRKGISRVH